MTAAARRARRLTARTWRLAALGVLLGGVVGLPAGCDGQWRRALDVRGFATELSGRGEDGAAFERAQRTNSSAAYAAYLAAYPSGLHEQEARAALEEASWREAGAAGTEAAYLDFAQRFPQSAHAGEATTRAGTACYAAATARRDVGELRAALYRWPGRAEVAPTLRLIEELELQAALAGVDPFAAVRFLFSYPLHPRSPDVAQRLADVERVTATGLNRPLVFALWLARFPGHAAAPEVRGRLQATPAPATAPAPTAAPGAAAAAESAWVTAAGCAVSLARTIRSATTADDPLEVERWREELGLVLAEPARGAQCSRMLPATPADPLARAALDALGALGTELGQLTRLVADARENSEVLRNIISLGRNQVETLERREVVGDALGDGGGSQRLSEIARQAMTQASAGAASADTFLQQLETLEQQLQAIVVTLMRYATWALDTRQ